MDKNGKTGRRYSAEEKAAAVRMVRNLRAELGTDLGFRCFGWASQQLWPEGTACLLAHETARHCFLNFPIRP